MSTKEKEMMNESQQTRGKSKRKVAQAYMTPLFLDMHIFTLDVLVIDSSSLIKRGRVG